MHGVMARVFLVFLLFGRMTHCLESAKDFSSVETVDRFEAKAGDNALRTIRGPPDVILVELSDALIRDLNDLWRDRNPVFRMSDTKLATFDSRGLQSKVLYRDSFKLVHDILNLKSHPAGRSDLPTFHVLEDLIQDVSVGGSITLITKSQISDENHGQMLANSLLGKKIQLSVLWMGSTHPKAYGPLSSMSRTTGGKFEFLLNRETKEETNDSQIALKANATEPFNQIRFPEELNSGDINSLLSLRVGSERFAGNFQFPLIVDVASGTSLEVRPGTPTRIPFTVKNNLNTDVNVVFGAKYKNAPQIIQPQRALLRPTATVTVTVHLNETPNRAPITNSTLIFSAFLPKIRISRSAVVSHVPLITYDKTEPKVYYKYGGDCTDYAEPNTCNQGFWGIEMTVQDEDSGLLKVVSEPYGLLFQSEFIAGTKNPVTVYYSASCCQPKVDIWAEDLNGNYVKKSMDVFNQTLLAGEIAAIVVGVFLLLFILIAICVGVVLVRRRNKRNLIIPRPRTESR